MAECPLGLRSSEKRIQNFGQNSWNIFGSQPGAKPDSSLAMQPCRATGRLKRVCPLSEKPNDQAGQNVA